ncbi:MAG: SPOR domain-containing protein [Paracoccaceae bacterium]|nr:SPOR domain-containing protein [Paracoccaceae bacterium]MDG1738880.1 SPOR domain-containing protein [Paracoccaceae bacterium]MDG2259552.1 SPOR domain-containing protein [Paracoccaceae bacterium]
MVIQVYKSAGMAVLGATFFLSACEDPQQLTTFLQPSGTPQETTVTVIEQEVEAPEVFYALETGLWDGRPSLGGIWVAHPDTLDPEQVIIRNTANGKFVIGSLFIRERAVPGPRLQVSSDAAVALEMVAGQPIELSVTALCKRELELAPATNPEPTTTPVPDLTELVAEAIEEPGQAGSQAPETRPIEQPIALVATPEPEPIAPAQVSTLKKPYIQIGIFGVEANARNTATAMRTDGIVPTVKEYKAQDKTFWRVLVGPAANETERRALLSKVREKGFADAYFVSG